MIDPATTLLIQQQVGDQDTNLLLPIIPVVWNAHASKDDIIDGLRYQYTLRDIIDVVRGQVWQQVQNTQGDAQFHLEQKHASLSVRYDDCQAEILRLEGHAQGNRAGIIGQLTTKTPRRPGPFRETPRGPYPDPNDAGYRGDPIIVTTTPDSPLI
jgi:hypothetical protein